MSPKIPPTPTVVRFDSKAHSFAGFQTGVSDVDDFFHPRSGSVREMLEKRTGDICVVAEDGLVVGCVAYTPRSVPDKIIQRLGPVLWQSKRHKPLDRGNFDNERDLVIPAVRIVILGVRRGSQGKGVGSALLRHVFSAVTAPFYYLHPFPPAIPFYEKFGFKRYDAESRPQDGNASVTASVMFKMDLFPD